MTRASTVTWGQASAMMPTAMARTPRRTREALSDLNMTVFLSLRAALDLQGQLSLLINYHKNDASCQDQNGMGASDLHRYSPGTAEMAWYQTADATGVP